MFSLLKIKQLSIILISGEIMNKPVCYIIGAGEHYTPPTKPSQGDLVIAADGGYAYLEGLNLCPDIFIGDFDSLDHTPEGCQIVRLPSEKDCTDTAAAIEIGWAKGYRLFHIYGGTGGRPDHTIANIQCVADIAVRGGQGLLFDQYNVITAIHNGKITFPPSASGYVSAFSHDDVSAGVDETGLKYSLQNATLKNTVPLGVSNEFTGKESSISVREGTLIIVYPNDIEKTQAF